MGDPIDELRSRHLAVIAIGGSAGALEVLVELLASLPQTFRAPVVVVVHLPADSNGSFADLLRSRCALAVTEAEDKLIPTGGGVYVAPADYHLLFERHGAMALSADRPVHYSRPSIDVLFESAALAFGPRVLGILLSGASADGAAGLASIRNRGGLTWVQSPDSARVPLMPREALAMAPHSTLTVEEMTRNLVEWGYAGA
jgi:two-component system, chemotaxis family, protein-glutamate methylesterase/glutaminase